MLTRPDGKPGHRPIQQGIFVKHSIGTALLCSLVPVVLTGCNISINSSSNGPDPLCKALGGGRSTVQSTPSAGSSLSDSARAFDGDLSTIASYDATTGNGTLVIRGTAQSGVVHGPGQAGLLLSSLSTDQTVQVTLSTYLDGALQATGDGGTQSGDGRTQSGQIANRDGQLYFSIDTTVAFDAIEASISLTGLPGSLKLRELCTN